MTDTTQDPELTPRDREMMRRGYAKRMMDCEHNPCTPMSARQTAEYAIPEPPAYTYSAEVYDTASQMWYRRRRDGSWESSKDRENWMLSFRTDTQVAALAACVPGLIPPKPVPTLWRVKYRGGGSWYTTDPAGASAAHWDTRYPRTAPHTVRAYAEVTP